MTTKPCQVPIVTMAPTSRGTWLTVLGDLEIPTAIVEQFDLRVGGVLSVVPATPAPSQPAGAREDDAEELYRVSRRGFAQFWLALNAYLRQQAAEIERLTAIAGDLTDRNDALTDESCKLQDDVASIVSTHRADWSWDDVLSDARNLKADRDLFQQENARLMDAQEKRELDEKARGTR